MADEVIKELWRIKDGMAEQFGYSPAALVAHLRAKKRSEGERVVDLRKTRKADEQIPRSDTTKPRD
jgi:hypothetical protein